MDQHDVDCLASCLLYLLLLITYLTSFFLASAIITIFSRGWREFELVSCAEERRGLSDCAFVVFTVDSVVFSVVHFTLMAAGVAVLNGVQWDTLITVLSSRLGHVSAWIIYPLLLFVPFPFLWAVDLRRTRVQMRHYLVERGISICIHCGYPLKGLGPSGACPECGRRFRSDEGLSRLRWVDYPWLWRRLHRRVMEHHDSQVCGEMQRPCKLSQTDVCENREG